VALISCVRLTRYAAWRLLAKGGAVENLGMRSGSCFNIKLFWSASNQLSFWLHGRDAPLRWHDGSVAETHGIGLLATASHCLPKLSIERESAQARPQGPVDFDALLSAEPALSLGAC
jgi:hypothetical protein